MVKFKKYEYHIMEITLQYGKGHSNQQELGKSLSSLFFLKYLLNYKNNN